MDLRNLCIRKNTKYLVYKAILENEVFIAFDDLEENTVEVFRWIIIKGRDLYYKEPFGYLTHMRKIRKGAKIRNQYNQVPNLNQDTVWESDKSTI